MRLWSHRRRHYRPGAGVEEFGVLSLVVSVMTLLEAFSDLGLSSALIRFGSESVAGGDLARFRTVASIVFDGAGRWPRL